MGTKAVFVDMAPSDGVKHVRGFNGALQPVEGRGTIALQGEVGKRVLIPDVLYVPGVQANLPSVGQLKESGVQLQGDGDEILLVASTGEVSVEHTTPDEPFAPTFALARRGRRRPSSVKHEVATGLDITPLTGADPPCVLCVGGKLARHTFPYKGSDAEEALAVVHIDLCGPFRVAAKDGSLYFLLLKDRHTRFVWAMLVVKKSDVLREFQQWLRELRTVVESVRTMLLHMGVQHHWWHLAVRQDIWSRGWEVLDLTDNKVVTSVEVIFYETLSLEVWKAKYGPASRRRQAHPQTDTSMATAPLFAEIDEPADEDVVEVLPPPPVLAPPYPVADRRASTPLSATGDEGSLEALPVAPASGIAGSRQGAKLGDQDRKPSTTGELVEQEAAAGVQSIGEQQTGRSTEELSKSAEESSHSMGRSSWSKTKMSTRKGSSRRVRSPPTATWWRCRSRSLSCDAQVDDDLLYDGDEEDEELPKLDPNVHANPEHRWNIATMTVKEALASWTGEAVKEALASLKGEAVKAAMGTWELVECPRGVNIMKNQWVMMTKYRIDDTVEREKARLVVKGFTQVYGADYDKTYSPVSGYVTLRIFLSIVAVFNLNLMQLDMKNAFLQSKLDRVLYMYQPDFFNDGTGRVCKLLKSLYGLKQSPLLWYRALVNVLLGAGWKKSQVDTALYFKAGNDGVTCWVLVYVNDLLAASSSTAMVKELKDLLEAAFELRKISPVVEYLGLEIVRVRPARKLWLHQQNYADKLRRRFIDEEQGLHIPKTPVSVDAYAELTFDYEEAQEREEEEYQQKVGSLQFTATTTRPDIAFTCSKLGSGFTVRSDQQWREVDHCLAYLTDTRNTTQEFGGGPESLELIDYVDTYDAGDKQNRASTGGYVFGFGGAAVSWSSQRIKCATLSSTELEYAAATDAGKEGRRLCFLLAGFKQLDAGKPTILRVDNKLAITVTKGLGLTGNLKHLERRYAWLQFMVRRRKFMLKYIPITEHPADFLTKALHFPNFNRCSVAIGQVRLADVRDGDDDVQQ
ncbi:unnamed protein product [Closterium sp. NIES-53]